MDKRLTFNEDEENYDNLRPTYCKGLFIAIIDYAQLDSTKKAVEVGIGTGQATKPMLDTGCSVTAIELGSKLASYSQNKFSGYSNFSIQNLAFEDAKLKSNSLDLIYSATAFHWIPESIGYPKVMDLLKKGGTLALFWNNPSGEKNSAHEGMQSLYQKYMPSQNLSKDLNDKFELRKSAIEKYGFKNLQFQLFHHTRTFDADTNVILLDTYSDHRSLCPDVKAAFYKEIKALINQQGGTFTIKDTMDLYLAKKL